MLSSCSLIVVVVVVAAIVVIRHKREIVEKRKSVNLKLPANEMYPRHSANPLVWGGRESERVCDCGKSKAAFIESTGFESVTALTGAQMQWRY